MRKIDIYGLPHAIGYATKHPYIYPFSYWEIKRTGKPENTENITCIRDIKSFEIPSEFEKSLF